MEHKVFIENFLSSRNPEQYIRDARNNGTLVKYFPRFAQLWGPEGDQDPFWHPEGNVFEHLCLVLRVLLGLESKANTVELRLTALFHDIAKPLTQHRWPCGGISNKGHAEAGARIFRDEYVKLIGIDERLAKRVFEMIFWHDFIHTKPQDASDEVVRIVLGLQTFDSLMLFEQVDVRATTRKREEQDLACGATEWLKLKDGI